MSNFLVGLTGGIGSGKSVASDRFETLGINIVDADLASRAVVEPGTSALGQIAQHFGADVIATDGSLDRTALRHRVFADPAERSWLQTLLHPLINQYLRDAIAAATSPYVVLVNPLLIETQQHAWCDRVLLIDAPEALQLERTMQRDDNTREQVENIMRAQASREQRRSAADDIIVNDGNLDELYAKVDAHHNAYLTSCQRQPVS